MTNASQPGIYRIVHIATGREYIGQSYRPARRWREHRSKLNRGIYHGPHLQAAWRKYGESAFRFEMLGNFSAEELTATEQRFINERKPAFNVAPASDSPRGVKHTEASRSNMRAGHKTLTAEQRARVSAAHIGLKQSAETIAKRNASRAWYRHDEDTKAKIRAGHIGRKVSEEARANMRAGWVKRRAAAEMPA